MENEPAATPKPIPSDDTRSVATMDVLRTPGLVAEVEERWFHAHAFAPRPNARIQVCVTMFRSTNAPDGSFDPPTPTSYETLSNWAEMLPF
jgi:hypothetical protein